MTMKGIDPIGIWQNAKLNNFGSGQASLDASKKGAPLPAAEEAEKAATEFEALMVQQMLKSMWQSVEKSGLISGGYEEELYQEMLQQEVAGHISKYQSFGIKDMVMREMADRVGSATPDKEDAS